MSDIMENVENDKDTVDPESLEETFPIKYRLLTEQAVKLNKAYLNKLTATKSLKLAVSVSDESIEVYELNNSSLSRVCRLSGHDKGLTELVFSPKEEHVLYSCGQDGVIKMWDTRASGSCVQLYQDEDDVLPKPYSCMDVSYNGRVFCAGSQLVNDDAYLVFWDQRNLSPLGGYWNSHTDDISQVKFHKNKTEILATGSLDSLINIFNIMEQSEDDALTYSLNVDNSVEKLTWLDDELLSCTTQSNDLQLWDTKSGDLVKSFTRDKIAKGIKRSRGDDCYLVDSYMGSDKAPVVLAGSYSDRGDVFRSATIADKKLQPRSNFTDNKQTVRCSHYDKEKDILVTAGESGIISVWRGCGAETTLTTSSSTIANKKRAHRHKPY